MVNRECYQIWDHLFDLYTLQDHQGLAEESLYGFFIDDGLEATMLPEVSTEGVILLQNPETGLLQVLEACPGEVLH